MRFAMFEDKGKIGLAASDGKEFHGLTENEAGYPGSLDRLLAAGADLAAVGKALLKAPRVDLESRTFLPPVRESSKILCLGLNYADHAAESGKAIPAYPDVFLRTSASVCGHNQALRKPPFSDQYDYEGELAMIIGKSAFRVSREKALDYVAGYSVFNDGSLRDFQLRVSQWAVGKNFDGSGGFGPWLVTPDELPPGAKGLNLQTRLNGKIVQNSNTKHLIFDIAAQIAYISQAMTLNPGDVVITGTPSGVGVSFTPPLFMKAGDICEVEIEGIGTLRNPVVES